MTTSDKPVVVASEVYPAVYGAQRSLLTLYEHWQREQRYQLRLVYIEDGPFSEAMRSLGIPSTKLEVGPLLGSFNKRLLRLRPWDYARLARELFAYNRSLKNYLKAQGANLLHCNTDRAGMMSFPGARWARCPLVTHLRREHNFGRLDRLIHAGTNEIVWISNRARDQFAQNHRISKLKGRVIYNGRALEDADGPSTRSDLLEEFDLPTEARLALMVASFDEAKDHETLVKAAEIACREEAYLYFLVAGMDATPDEARRKKIEKLAMDAGLNGRMLFLGHRDDVGRLMRGTDVVVHASKLEALGGTLMEALAYGVPCVATNTGGIPEVVLDSRCGYLVPCGDFEMMASRTLELLRDDATRATFANNARAHFEANFTAKRCADKTGQFFDEIIAGRAKKHPPISL